jgi:hypothetical protein
VALADGGGDVGVARQNVGDAEPAQVVLVPEQARGEDGRAGRGGELDGDTANAAGGAGDQHRVAV